MGDTDLLLLNSFSKMMVLNVDVLGLGTHAWSFCKFDPTNVVFEHLALDDR